MVRNTSKADYKKLFDDPRVLSRDDVTYKQLITPFRKACGLFPLYIEPDGFSGEWILNEKKSEFGRMGVANSPNKMMLVMKGDTLNIERSYIIEWDDDTIYLDTMVLDGSEMKSEFWNSPRVTSAELSETGDSITIKSTTIFNRDGQSREITSSEYWNLSENRDTLQIFQKSQTLWGQ